MIKYRPYQLIMEIAGAAALLFAVVFLIVCWNDIPDMIVTNTAVDGKETIGAKTVLFFLPFLALVFCGTVTAVQFSPVLWNRESKGGGLPPEDAKRIKNATLTVLIFEKLLIALITMVMAVSAVTKLPYQFAFVIAFIVLFIGAIIVYIVYSRKIRNAHKKKEG